ncbi:alpha/beta-hydrolase [Colletotrichum somersetense]|nr:alpha/beta-hydrolase [Colletotrichum somersetense]
MVPHYVNSIQVLQCPSPQVAWDRPKQPSCVVLLAGSKRTQESCPLDYDIILEQDQSLTLRDGVSIRVDIYRRKAEGKVPAVLMLDPAEWVPKGYAIGQDGHDAVEEIAKLPWCSGKIALAENSWLAVCQWFIAAERPPHLACIAPLEGCSDHLRESLCRGGIPDTDFAGLINGALAGTQDDKRPSMDRIQVPAYILGSYSTMIHTIGSFRGFEEIPHQRKWLAVLGFNKPPILNLPFDRLLWHSPYTPTTNAQKLFLTQNKSLQLENEANYGTLDYKDTERLELSYTFRQSTTLEVPNINPLKYLGPSGQLRSSRRKVAPELSQRCWQTLTHDTYEPVKAEEIVKLEIWIWPSAIQFESGEQLVLQVSGNYIGFLEFEHLGVKPNSVVQQIVHVGGNYQTYLEVTWFT